VEVQLDPNSPYPYRNLADAFKNTDWLAEAEATYRTGITQNPSSVFIYHELAEFLSEQERYEEAEPPNQALQEAAEWYKQVTSNT